MLRHAFHTALLHLNPPPKPSCQMRSPLLMLPVCSRLAKMYLDSMHACKAYKLHPGLSHYCSCAASNQPHDKALVCQMQAWALHAGIFSDSLVRRSMSSSEC